MVDIVELSHQTKLSSKCWFIKYVFHKSWFLPSFYVGCVGYNNTLHIENEFV